ncbi:MAG: 4Fe-4S dicluster domain-containing protein [Bacteroidota bacterium]|nr:4Fe-4S dicluster domain-containing protein [Bacteroidota bacterium]MDP4231287.1 4Fe-4S dicluster domain-containing protein [Bacteroidota bacterium]MDP4236021.1 4Fe-4S dicluster domain-containing protein [Bacteroidota bacterium]
MSQPPPGAVPPWLRQGADRNVSASPGATPSVATQKAPTAPTPEGSQVAEASAAAPAKKKKAKLLAVVHMEGCTGCDVCVEFCPVDCIYHIPGPEHILAENPHASMNGVVMIDEDVCIGCKLCAKYCPWETIEMIDSDALEEARALGLTY